MADLMSDAHRQSAPSPQDIERGFALVKAARAVLQEMPERRVSDTTRRKYTALFVNMQAAGKRPEEIAGTRRSFYVYRAAVNFMLPEMIRERLRAADRAAKAKDRVGWWQEILLLRGHLESLNRYLPDPGGERVRSGQRSKIAVPRGQSLSKRGTLKRMPENWREKLWGAVSAKSKYRGAIGACILTGVRPAELVKGVEVRVKPNGDLIFDIRGAKTQGGRYGQLARRLIVAAPGVIGDFFRKALDGTRAMTVCVGDARLFGNQLSEYGRKCWPRKRERISPYSLRHQFAADLKATGDADAVSLALGHSVADTAQHYGTARQAKKGGGKLLAVETTRALRKERKQEKTKAIERFQERALTR
jgi:integrase